jgi:hypothetical protein
VGLPKDNLTILGLARKLAGEIKRDPIPAAGSARAAWAASERTKLKTVTRYQPTEVKRAWRLNNTKNKGLETLSYRFEFANGLGATAVWAKAMASPSNAPATLMLNDEGKKAAGAEVSDRVNRGEQVLALDLLFTGDSAPEKPLPGTYALKLATTGDRPLGLEAAQLVAVANWLRAVSDNRPIRLESAGMRSQVAGMLATALEPELFSELVTHEGMDSLGHLLDVPIAFRDAPDLFCLDLYKDFDLDRLAVLAEPARLTAK